MTTRRVRQLRDLVIDEISLVDKGANQHATVTIAKRHGEEEQDMDKYFDGDGNPVDIASLEIGDTVFDAQGRQYEYVLEDEEPEVEEEPVEEREPELVGKALRREPQETKVTKSFAEEIRVELSKALTDKDRDEVIAKALGKIEDIAKRAEDAEKAAEAERQLRLEREYTEIAKSYSVPVAPETLGPVLMRVAETLSVEDQKVIQKCLEAASDATEELFEEIGKRGGGDNSDIFTQVEAAVDEVISKTNLSREEAIAQVFNENPEAYDNYLAEKRQR